MTWARDGGTLRAAMFVDRIKILAQAGNGGRGCVSFRREKFVPKGGPDGGDGGRGGDIILRADQHVDNLSNLFYEPIIKAKNGIHGKGKKMHGKAGVPKIVRVPIGTVVYQSDERGAKMDAGEEHATPNEEAVEKGTPRNAIADLTAEGQEYLLARGGKGGKGNVHFKSSRNRAPIHTRTARKGRTVISSLSCARWLTPGSSGTRTPGNLRF